MIFGIGMDVFEVERMAELVVRGRPYLETLFTGQEIAYCESKARPFEHYAARYAAKEAVLKALGIGGREGLAFCEIEILNDELGRPQASLHGRVKEFYDNVQVRGCTISLSHTRKLAIAVAVLEK